jgi:hypothetical protein
VAVQKNLSEESQCASGQAESKNHRRGQVEAIDRNRGRYYRRVARIEELLKGKVREARGNCRFVSVQGWASWRALRAGTEGLERNPMKDQVLGRLGRSVRCQNGEPGSIDVCYVGLPGMQGWRRIGGLKEAAGLRGQAETSERYLARVIGHCSA